MRRYANRDRDFMAYAGEPAPSFKPPQMPSQLDPKDERLLELSAEVGNLQGQLDMLAEDNSRLEDENRELRSKNENLRESNQNYEIQAASDKATYDTANEIIESVKKSLKENK